MSIVKMPGKLETMVCIPFRHVLIKLDVWKAREQLADDGRALSTFRQHVDFLEKINKGL